MSIMLVMKTFELGLIFSILSMGVYIGFRILNVPDLTVDASFVTGAAVTAMCTLANHPYLGLITGFFAGMLCGIITGLLQTKMKMQPILAGILTMTGLYSVNLMIMKGAPNISLYGMETIFTITNQKIFVLIGVTGFIYLGLVLFFKTRLGLMIRATGDNEKMVLSSSINANRMKLVGLSLANGIVGLAGGILCQYQNYVDVSGGTGMMVLGLAGVIIGEACIARLGVSLGFLKAMLGAVFYRMIYMFALQMGIPATNMNLVSACLVALMISLPYLRKSGEYHG